MPEEMLQPDLSGQRAGKDWGRIITYLTLVLILANVLGLDFLVLRKSNIPQESMKLKELEKELTSVMTMQGALEKVVGEIATFSALPVVPPTAGPTEVQKEKVVERVVTQAPVSQVKEYHIPLGYAALATEHYEWVDTGVEATFDITNYGAVQEAKFEATLSVPEGQVEVRLYNVSDRNVIGGSTLVGDSQSPQLHRSANLNFPAGAKTYRVQLRTSINVTATMHSGEIRILLK